MKKIYFKTKQQPHEGLVSLVIRLAGSQLTRPSDFLSAFGKKEPITRTLYRSAANNQKTMLINLLSLGKYESNPALERIASEHKLRPLLRFHTQSVCPDCIERGYTLLVHDFYGVEACHIHDCQLLQSCPSCHEEILIDRKSLALCQCGQPLTERRKASNDSIYESNYLSRLLSNQLSERLTGYLIYRRLIADRYNVSHITQKEVEGFDRGDSLFIGMMMQRAHPDILILPIRALLSPLLNTESSFLANMANNYLGNHSISDQPIRASNTASEIEFYLTTKELKTALGCKPLSAAHIINIFFGGSSSTTIHTIAELTKFYEILSRSTAVDDLQHQYTISEIADITKTPAHDVINQIPEGKFSVVKFDTCLPITQAVVQTTINLSEDLPDRYLTIELTASYLDTYTEVIRSLRDCGHIAATHQKTRNNRYIFPVESLDDFKDQYVLISEIAEKLNSTSKRLSDQLIHAGINPAGGPTIDGTVVYFFRRHEIQSADLVRISESTGYETSSGRKTTSHKKLNSKKWATATETALALKVSPQKLNTFVAKNLLTQGFPDHRSSVRTRYFKRSTITRTQEFIDSLIPLELATEQLDIDVKKCIRRLHLLVNENPWPINGTRYLSPQQFNALSDHMTHYWDSATAARYLGVNRHTINNWKRLGLLTPVNQDDHGFIAAQTVFHASDIKKLKEA